ncbi:hypothetical protein [Streptomyces sp. NBRC 110035]|uniref:hypothetical protein n=1 Tax=Streptomyces sp. NBRC 110035 TaxID=1547867 RepID=UPI0005A846AB|nr:hypothetical protein [Streptomyces sp. NBRC 110035]
MPTNHLHAAIHRVADILETRMNQLSIYDTGAPITDQVLLYAVLPIDPKTAFDWDQWTTAYRQTRRDGTRPAVKTLHNELRDLLTQQLGGEIGLAGGGTYYTPDQVRQTLASTGPAVGETEESAA